jgi:uncharacterized protein
MATLLRPAAFLALAIIAFTAMASPVTDAIYPAPQLPLSLDGLAAGSRMITVPTADGLKVRGILAPGRTDRPLLLVFHGNASSAVTALRWLGPLAQDGYRILAADYRGYSGNPGRPSEAGLLADARAFLTAARAEAAGQPVWVVGHSLGGGVALALSRSERLDTIVTIGTFTRIRDMAPGMARAFVPDDYRNIDAIKALDEPFFLIHGGHDEVVPSAHGKALFDAATGKSGAAFLVKNASHQPAASDLRTIFAVIAAKMSNRPAPPLPDQIQSSSFRPR